MIGAVKLIRDYNAIQYIMNSMIQIRNLARYRSIHDLVLKLLWNRRLLNLSLVIWPTHCKTIHNSQNITVI